MIQDKGVQYYFALHNGVYMIVFSSLLKSHSDYISSNDFRSVIHLRISEVMLCEGPRLRSLQFIASLLHIVEDSFWENDFPSFIATFLLSFDWIVDLIFYASLYCSICSYFE